jgi:hypothetical protein
MGPAVCAAGIRQWGFFIKSSIPREELRQEINELAVGQVFRQGAFKQHILEIKKQFTPEEASTNNKLS